DYPQASLQQYRVTPGAPSILYSALLTSEQVAAPRGLTAQYKNGPADDAKPAFSRRDKTLDFDWRQTTPLPPPFLVDWTGTLAAPSLGDYAFRLDGPADAILKIDEAELLRGGQEKTIHLAEGTHRI